MQEEVWLYEIFIIDFNNFTINYIQHPKSDFVQLNISIQKSFFMTHKSWAMENESWMKM